MDYAELFSKFPADYIGRPLTAEDGIEPSFISEAEARLEVTLSVALKEYYKALGAVDKLNKIHNQFLAPCDLRIEGNYLIFMDENQSVVSWGLPLSALGDDDPIVWQRNNTPPGEWFSEEKSFSKQMRSMFDWYKESDIFGASS